MIDPATATAVISGLVGTLTTYLNYRVGMKQADQKAIEMAQPDDTTTKQAETLLPVVRQGVQQYGDQREQTALANFEDDPEMYRSVIERVLVNIATRQPKFLQQLQATQQTTVQGRGVNVSGDVYGNVIDQNSGTLNSTYNFGNRDNNT